MRRPFRVFFAVAVVLAISPFAPSHASPTWVETATLTHAGGGAGDHFGTSVAVDGDVIVVGESKPFDNPDPRTGSVHVFVRALGTWTEVAQLLPSDSAPGDRFGVSVAIHGDTIAVGAVDVLLGTGGTIYMFVRPAGGWGGTLNENARLDASSAGVNPLIGFSIAFAGDSVVTNSAALAHQLFVFDKPASGWSGIVPPNASPACQLTTGFLYDVAASGDVVVAGAPYEPVGRLGDVGKVCVWVKPAGGWNGSIPNVAYLLPSAPFANQAFGFALAIDGTTVLAGNQWLSEKVHAFEQPSTGWAGNVTETAVLEASDSVLGDGLGFTISMSGGKAAIGAPNVVYTLLGPQGALYVYDRPAGGWSGTVFETAEFFGPSKFSYYTLFLGASADVVVATANAEDVNGNASQGTAHVYELRDNHRGISFTRFLVEGPVFVHPGDPVQFRVRVEGQQRATSAPQGVVVVSDEMGEVCRVLIDPAAGEGACELTFSSPGMYRVRGHYLGNADFNDSWTRTVPVHVDTRGGH